MSELPALRQELQIQPGPMTAHGLPSWTLYDPIQHKYFRLDETVFTILAQWSTSPTKETLLKKLARFTIDEQQLSTVEQFLNTHQLIKHAKKISKPKLTWHDALLKLCFFNISLFQPQNALQAWLPYFGFIFSKYFIGTWLILTSLGLFLVSHQWDQFTHAFNYLYQPSGWLLLSICLIFLKFCHELGHALMATRFQVPVTSMGIAFIVFWPRFFTDTTTAWSLASRQHRLAISCAGVMVELIIAGLALFIWSFLPTGPFQTCLTFIITTSVVMTLLVNLNPCLKFDGYYFLADVINIDNLQSKSFALARWQLRHLIFGAQYPEHVHHFHTHRIFLISYAWLTWIVRLVYFLGIIYVVYNFVFKALGIILFIVLTFKLLLMPIFKEIQLWFTHLLPTTSMYRKLCISSCIAILLLICAIPQQWSIKYPAVYTPHESIKLYPVMPSQVSEINIYEGKQVQKGDILIRFTNTQLNLDIESTRVTLAVIDEQIRLIMGSKEHLIQYEILLRRKYEAETKLSGLVKSRTLLTVHAPFSGKISWVDPALTEKMWINNNYPYARLSSENHGQLNAFITAEDLQLFQPTSATFYPESPELTPLPVTVMEVGSVNLLAIDEPLLQSTYGGDIPINQDQQQQNSPVTSIYPLQTSLNKSPEYPIMRLKGTIVAKSKPVSLAVLAWKRVLSILRREVSI
ncbi:site-2 protease family protein [Zooshikella sp. RANM57]|uniref:site-2 protease family protein n=1 Tax=Zooshikella sp. RANM57 TaxID=3425863 RepID=UPI003D6F9DC2